MSKSSLPKQPVIDTKVRDTTGDQVLRFILRFINFVWTASLALAFLPVGIIWGIGSIAVMLKLRERRRQRYSNNARTLAELNYGRSI